MRNLVDKVALVTGSSKGIGKGIAIRLAEEGCNVVLNYRSDAEGAKSTLQKISSLGRRGITVQADVSKMEDIQKLMDESFKQFGVVDVLVNNAGIEKYTEFWDYKEEDFQKVMDTNLKGPFFCSREYVKRMKELSHAGKIINISSVHEEIPFLGNAPYCCAKGGLKMLTRTLAMELAPLNITVNSVAPGAIQTSINAERLQDKATLDSLLSKIPLKRLGKPSDVAGLVAFLASSDADYITDGGLTWKFEE